MKMLTTILYTFENVLAWNININFVNCNAGELC